MRRGPAVAALALALAAGCATGPTAERQFFVEAVRVDDPDDVIYLVSEDPQAANFGPPTHLSATDSEGQYMDLGRRRLRGVTSRHFARKTHPMIPFPWPCCE